MQAGTTLETFIKNFAIWLFVSQTQVSAVDSPYTMYHQICNTRGVFYNVKHILKNIWYALENGWEWHDKV